jgi:hypothetical protein
MILGNPASPAPAALTNEPNQTRLKTAFPTQKQGFPPSNPIKIWPNKPKRSMSSPFTLPCPAS